MRVQSPRRDEETKAKWEPLRLAMDSAVPEIQPHAFCKSLEFLLDRVNVMLIDAANPLAPYCSGDQGPRHRLRARQVPGQAQQRLTHSAAYHGVDQQGPAICNMTKPPRVA